MAHAALALTKMVVEITKALVETGIEIHQAREARRAAAAGAAPPPASAAAAVAVSAEDRRAMAKEYADARASLVACTMGGRDAMFGEVHLKLQGLYYRGVFVDDELEGQGEMRTATTTYTGRFHEGLPHGEGRCVSTNGSVYVGHWVMGDRHGFGQVTTAGGTLFSGEFVHNQFVRGTVVTGQRGIVFEGECSSYSPVNGTLTYPSGITYRGIVKDWLWHDNTGNAVLTFPKRNAETGKPYSAVSYRGSFDSCKYHGFGDMTWRSGKRWRGQWRDNVMVAAEGEWVSVDHGAAPLISDGGSRVELDDTTAE